MEERAIKNVLDAIHYLIEVRHIHISDEELKRLDDEIIPYIKDNFEYDEKEFRVIQHGVPKLANDSRVIPIAIRYFAIHECNLELLKKLGEAGYDFLNDKRAIKFYALDKQMSSKFKERDYIRYLMKHDKVFEHFERTLIGLNRHDREKYIKEFAEMVKSDVTVLNIGSGKHENCNFLTRKNLELFGKDFLLSLNEKQRNLINSFYFQIDKEDAEKLKELVIKYPDFKMIIPLYSSVLNAFTIDELATMPYEHVKLYEVAMRNDLIDRMKNILKMNPAFTCPLSFIRYEIFKVLDDETILKLSDKAIDEIASLRFVESKKVYVFPVKKINKIVAKDIPKKKKEGIFKK